MRQLLISIFLSMALLAINYVNAQPNLVLSKPGVPRHIYYHLGDRISYQDKSTGYKHSGIIYIMTDSTIELDHAPRININNIRVIYRKRPFLMQAAGSGIVVLGVYFPVSVLNRVFNKEYPIVNNDILIVEGSMLAVSGISWLFLTRHYRIGYPWKLQILDFGHPVYN